MCNPVHPSPGPLVRLRWTMRPHRADGAPEHASEPAATHPAGFSVAIGPLVGAIRGGRRSLESFRCAGGKTRTMPNVTRTVLLALIVAALAPLRPTVSNNRLSSSGAARRASAASSNAPIYRCSASNAALDQPAVRFPHLSRSANTRPVSALLFLCALFLISVRSVSRLFREARR